jgi:hypothetical protein
VLGKILNYLVYSVKVGKGKTGGSRVKFNYAVNDVINLHKPHPGYIVKQYVIRQILEKLKF